jgi:hypothetical protein
MENVTMNYRVQNYKLYAAALLALQLSITCPAWVINTSESCTWGIANSDWQIPAGSVPVSAVLTLSNVSMDTSQADPTFNIYLLHNPQSGLVNFAESFDSFEGYGTPIGSFTQLTTPGQDLAIDLAQVNNPQSQVWSVFPNPFTLTLGNQKSITCSSALLELMNYSGSGKSFGFGFYSRGFVCSGLNLDITVQSLSDASAPQIFSFSLGNIHSPQLQSIPDYSISTGQTLEITLAGSDPDQSTSLVYSAENLPQGASLAGPLFSWTPTLSQEGAWQVIFGVSDGMLTTTQTVTITVIHTNNPPVLNAIQNIQITAGTALSTQLSASDSDNDVLTYSILSGPAWMSASAAGLLTGTPTAGNVGTTSLTIQVSDGNGGTDTAAITVTVGAALPVWIPILYDEFESGMGNWVDGGTNCLRYVGTAYAHQGTGALNLQDNTGSSIATTNNLALSQYSKIKVDFWYTCISFDSKSEDFWVQISTNGGKSYTTVEEWNLTDEFVNGPFYQGTVTITGRTLTNLTRIRFRCDASAANDDVYIDQVAVSVQ